ncbi:MAG: hypothetical protein HY815_10570 [Candidatus Riflebacteria bacterium]|nr:hypothetical protein [Candidatus Riflebacteria bacterium]
MTTSRRLLLVTGLVVAASAWAQPARRDPHIGYLYPAGGKQGSVVQVSAGGQFLKDASRVYVSGSGVRATVTRYVPPMNVVGKELAEQFRQRLRAARDGHGPAMDEPPSPSPSPAPSPAAAPPGETGDEKAAARERRLEGLMDHPLIKNLDQLSPGELQYVAKEFRKRNRRQRNPQIAETVLLEITIDPDAAPGDRELRLQTAAGLTNPLCFQVGQLPEVLEHEPNNPDWPQIQQVQVPALLNGQLLPGDVDCFKFRATSGQRLVIEAEARRLIPFLADAVPGWFQATLTLRDSGGNEVAYADERGADPDPVMLCRIPRDDEYRLEIRDSIDRGRQDFVYRVALRERVDRPDPASSAAASPASSGSATEREPWARVDGLPELRETEPNDDGSAAQELEPPVVVTGTIGQPGDEDVFRFRGRAGDSVVAEITARRQGSPLDSLLRLTDASGKVVAWNDDHKEVDAGPITHHADSWLMAKLPADGIYHVRVADVQRHGGPAFQYRLRVSPPLPDFVVFVTPSGVNMGAAPAVPLTVQAVRRDGFDGAIDVALKNPPPGFGLGGARIPRGRESIRMTLTAPPGPLDPPVALQLEGHATVDGRTVSRPVLPADDLTQAFMLHHLAPAEAVLVSSRPNRRAGPPVRVEQSGVLRIPSGGTVQALVRLPGRPMLRALQFELSEPPKGLSLQSVRQVPLGRELVLEAEDKAPPVGHAGNLIVEVFMERQPGPKEGKAEAGKATAPKVRFSVGVLPAVPFEIVPR